MQVYPWLRRLLFLLPPETAHRFTFSMLRLADKMALLPTQIVTKPCTVMGITFLNPIGFAAGLDKNATAVTALSHLGVGFIEVGTVTPKARGGNLKPRVFRIPQFDALINRMNLPNDGLDVICERLKELAIDSVLGVNIGKNTQAGTSVAIEEYIETFRRVAPFADYVTINVSCPAAADLRMLQLGQSFKDLLHALKGEQQRLAKDLEHYVPLAVKLSPDHTREEYREICQTLLQYEIDGVIATNTTRTRPAISALPIAKEEGGLSGAPLFELSSQVVAWLEENLQGKIPIIAAGGIDSAARANRMFAQGAKLIQIYTGFIYQGPRLIQDILSELPR